MKVINKIYGIELLQMIANNEIDCGTMIRHKRDDLILCSNPPQPVYEYYKYTAGDKRFHRCDENGKLGATGQQRFMNYATLNKEFEVLEIIEEDKWDYTMRQISKMIASGDLKDIYAKYLSNCPIGFMKEEDIYDYILKNVEVGTIEEEQDIEEVLEIELLGQGDNWLQNTQSKDKLESVELNPYILKVITRNFELLYEKQCELIKAVNELKNKE